MTHKKLLFNCKTFNNHLLSHLSDLLTEHSYSDVTLVSDDQIAFQAHKFVLSASSPVLRNLLLNNPNSHPLIYLRGIAQQDLHSLIQFMYTGEFKVHSDQIDSFVNAAKDLEMKELFQLTAETLLDKQDVLLPNEADDEYGCDESSTFEGNTSRQSLKCEDCATILSNRSHLMRHRRSKHEGIRYSCNQCEYQAKQTSNLKTHQESKHGVDIYSCEQCEYQAKTASHLKRHQAFEHEGIRYSCNECDYQATYPSNLKAHQKYKHVKVR